MCVPHSSLIYSENFLIWICLDSENELSKSKVCLQGRESYGRVQVQIVAYIVIPEISNSAHRCDQHS
jgi:hypothetical protein